MKEIEREYTLLFNGITDTIRDLEKTINRLKYLQQAAEEEYLSAHCPEKPLPMVKGRRVALAPRREEVTLPASD